MKMILLIRNELEQIKKQDITGPEIYLNGQLNNGL